MNTRTCAVPGCTQCMSDGGTRYCAAHGRKRGYDTRRSHGATFLFKCAGCPFEAHISNRKRNKVYCDDCAEDRERAKAAERGKRARANAGAAGASSANGTEACPPTQRSEQ